MGSRNNYLVTLTVRQTVVVKAYDEEDALEIAQQMPRNCIEWRELDDEWDVEQDYEYDEVYGRDY